MHLAAVVHGFQMKVVAIVGIAIQDDIVVVAVNRIVTQVAVVVVVAEGKC